MKKLILPLVAVLLCMASCQKENGILYLVTEHYTSGSAKLHIDDEHYAVWDNNDDVLVNGEEYAVAVGSGTATITGVPESSTYTAIYPASWASAGGTGIKYPAEQTYRKNSDGVQIVEAPMAGYSEGTNNLIFHNLGSILAVKVTNLGSEAMSVQKIEVSSASGVINGTFLVQDVATTPRLQITMGGGSTTTTLKCNGESIAAGASKTFLIAMPTHYASATASCGFAPKLTVKVYDQYYAYTKAQTEAVALEANHGYYAPVATSDAPVQYAPKNNQILYTATTQSYVNSYMTDVYTMSEHTFADGKGIITFSTDINTIPESTFYDNHNLTSVTLPASVSSIGNSAFSGCNALTSIDLSHTQITTLGNNAFSNCRTLASISWPATLTAIGDSVFFFCNALTSLTLPANLTTIGKRAFYECSALASISLPETLTAIGDYAFYACIALTSLTLPDAVTTLGEKPFSGTQNLASITLPANLTTTGEDPFTNGSRKLNTFYCSRTTPYTDLTAAELGITVSATKTLHVPNGTADNWRSWWSRNTTYGIIVDDL